MSSVKFLTLAEQKATGITPELLALTTAAIEFATDDEDVTDAEFEDRQWNLKVAAEAFAYSLGFDTIKLYR